MEVMTPRLLLLSIAPVFAAATAHAQAPGEWTDGATKPPPYAPVGYAPSPTAQPGYAQPPPDPGHVAPVAPPRVRKWSVGLNFGQTELTAKNEYAEESVTFGTGSLALRYRGWRHLELEFSIGGGRQSLDEEKDGRSGEGDLAIATGTLAARYRFNPQAKWNWWLLAGVGATTVARHDATEEEVDAAQRPHGTLGVGIERRWSRFALQFELRALAVGQTEEEMELADQGIMTTEGLSGGTFAFGASYYF
jgi:hypothetical protein